VRDQATKSLSRILSHSPSIISGLITNFNNCNDPYLVERLYAAIYGAIFNIKSNQWIKDIASSVFNNVFENGCPYPNILIRDYARGIIEFAHVKGQIALDINISLIRPPYKSDWPIENPSLEEIEHIVDDNYSAIKNSMMGYIGDFGKYTMSCIHKWSPTPLSEKNPETSYEIHLKFAGTLPNDLKDRYINHLNKKVQRNNSDFNINEFLISNIETKENLVDKSDGKQKIDDWEDLKKQIQAILDNKQKEFFRWVSGLGFNNRPATFSRKWAQRWVCKRAYELGWKSSLFEKFERIHAVNDSRKPATIERIGKKYQWIAFHELLARMSDNLHWIDRGYTDVDDSMFWGPWQISKRDIDPTFWIRETGDSEWDERVDSFWWRPYKFPFVDDDIEKQKSWMNDKTIIPNFNDILETTNPFDNKRWMALRGFSKWSKEPEKDKTIIPTQDAWFRINSCFVKKKDFSKFKKNVIGKNLCDPHILMPISTGHQGFLKEYPWHPIYKDMSDWTDPDKDNYSQSLINIKHIKPINQYDWEIGNEDKSIKQTISLYLPSKYLIDEFNLSLAPFEYGLWVKSDGSPVFFDPSSNSKGPSFALIQSELLKNWLERNDLQLVWLVGGEKQLYTNMASKFYGRLVYSGCYTFSNDNIDGEMWFIEEPGYNED
ncbi:hypothetical protein, partial [Peribacillus frigoritolerans]|uniref:hypothetical protein n=1 Tax=Peribacillus castrilensis TaxID=2897690 RepID=UPI002DC69C12|nr:hypothetical protein [Peribacillus castrilensis]